MKMILKPILKYYLKLITKIVLFIHRPTIIAIAGATNKTFTKNRIKKTLEEKGINVRANPNNFNTEIGLPLAILYLPSGYNYYSKWLPVILKAPLAIFQTNFPQYLVLELGTSDAGDMKYLLSIVSPKITVITDITRKYLEGFTDMDQLVGEYRMLARKTHPQGLLVLNNDNVRIRSLVENIDTKKIFFGFQEGSNPRILDIKREKEGEVVNIKYDQEETSHNTGRFGHHHAYALMAGLIINKHLSHVENKKEEGAER
jgi:UDP-N-acetylmuramyl pentapeptide synthase